ncbi:MAG: CRISPR system precrRNA processing endoribonuclease RAMP protein Cas6 [Candidatus Schekmanbacteria bacterium]|nr:CRISPR system precrRNA processing endoribonuclease RAMP protein Cas6 [Candidatus Schekmanbacteria bacterium]
MLSKFHLSRYRFKLSPFEKLHLQASHQGVTLRGAFGYAFKNLCCHDFQAACKDCLQQNRCPYSLIFEPVVPPDAQRLRCNTDIPRPFIIKPPINFKSDYNPGEYLGFDLVIIGDINKYLPYFIACIDALADKGMGTDRSRFRLESVSAVNGNEAVEIYSSRDTLVRNINLPVTFKQLADGSTGFQPVNLIGSTGISPVNHGLEACATGVDVAVCPHAVDADVSVCPHAETNKGQDSADKPAHQQITIRFHTPTILKADGRIIRQPEFHHIIKRLRDRINSLAYFYCGETLEIDYKALGDAAETIRLAAGRFQWHEVSRYSTKRQIWHELSGFTGYGVYSGDLRPFLPLLALGEYVHVGKGAAFGNGWLEITKG